MKRFKPPTQSAGQQAHRNAPGRLIVPGGIPGGGQTAAIGTGPGNLPPIGRTGQQASAAQLASARAAAAARQPLRVQALGAAYGGGGALGQNKRAGPGGAGPGGPGGGSGPGGRGPPLLQMQGIGGVGGSAPRRLSSEFRMGNRLPPAAPSARLAARLGGAPPRS